VALEGNIANPDITWERKKQIQTGVEFTLGDIVDGIGVNGANIKNELLALPENTPQEFINTFFDGGNLSVGYQVGRSIFDYYYREYAGVDPADGLPMWYEYFDDLNDNDILDAGEEIEASSLEVHKFNNPESDNFKRQTTKEYDAATQKYVNKSFLPDLQGAFRLSGNVKDFTYAFQFTYQFGGYGYDNQYREFFERGGTTASGTLHADIRDRWQQPGDITNVPKLGNGSVTQDVGPSDRFLIKTDYIGLNSVNIGYNLGGKMLENTGIDNINLFVSGDNLFISTARKGYNPNVREAGDTRRNQYAPLSSFTVGLYPNDRISKL